MRLDSRLILPALALLILAPLAARGAAEDLVTRARSTEAAQLAALSRAPVRVQAEGRATGGKRARDIAWTREISYAPDGSVAVRLVAGAAPSDQDGKRRAPPILGPLTLAPFSAPRTRVEVEGTRLRVTPLDAGPIAAVLVEVDPGTGAKRALEVVPAELDTGHLRASRIRLIFSEDGAIARFESHVEALAFGRSRRVDVEGRRVVEAAAR